MLRVKINFVGAENIERERERKEQKAFNTGVEPKNSRFSRVEAMKHRRNPLNLHHERKILARFDKEMWEIIIYAGDVKTERAKQFSGREKSSSGERKIVFHEKGENFVRGKKEKLSH
jgi:hypothetical protein